MAIFSRKIRLRAKKGETVLEVLMALVILTMASTVATSLIITAMQANLFNRDSLVALNLAQEGIEYMRNVRDSNWLRFSADPQKCWLMRPDAPACAPANVILPTNEAGSAGYPLGNVLDVKQNPGLDLNTPSFDATPYLLKYFDLDIDTDSDGNLNMTDDNDYVGSFYPGFSSVDSKFYRSIEVEYQTIAIAAPWALLPTSNPAMADIMVVRCTVQWREAGGGGVHSVSLASSLSRYR